MSDPRQDRRQRRYDRRKPEHGMTPFSGRVLRYIAECGILVPQQVSRITGTGSSGTGKHLRTIFDHGFAERVPVPMATLLPESARRDPALMFTLGPDAYKPTRAGLDWLATHGLSDESWRKRRIPEFSAGNTYFLAHELLTRDVRVWLELCARAHGGGCLDWRYGPDAHRPDVRPDAEFRFALPSGDTFTGLVEADRGTERGDKWWPPKVAAYSEMQDTGEVEYVMVVALDETRRDRIAEYAAGSGVAPAFFCCVREDLYAGGMDRAMWRRPGKEGLHRLVPDKYLVHSGKVPPG